MDPLSRIAPIAADLLHRVDVALTSLGASAEHEVWALLRELRATPTDVVEFFLAAEPAPIRDQSVRLVEVATGYDSITAGASSPATVAQSWTGMAGAEYAATARAVVAHLSGGPDSLHGRLVIMARFADDIADWFRRSRATVAMAIADVLNSSEALTVRQSPDLGTGVAELTRRPGGVPAEVMRAAADISVHILQAAAVAHTEGEQMLARWLPALDELAYQVPVGEAVVSPGATIAVWH